MSVVPADELEHLSLETEKLLAACRGERQNPKKPAPQRCVETTNYQVCEKTPRRSYVTSSSTFERNESPSKRKKKKEAVLMEEGSLKGAVPHNHNHKDAQTKGGEAALLDFESQEARVRLGADAYVPVLGVKLAKLEKAKKRLAKIEQAQAESAVRAAYAGLERTAQKLVVKQELAAVQIQRRVRGAGGRLKAMVVREDLELKLEVAKRWVWVRDSESGDVWYYNTLTQESRWERPDASIGLIPSKSEIVTLPPVQQSKTEGQSRLTETERLNSAPSLRSQARAQVLNDAPAADPEPGDALYAGENGNDDDAQEMCESENASSTSSLDEQAYLVRPDGTVSKLHLREAVQETLRTHRFDSVRALLQQPRRDKKMSTFLKFTQANGGADGFAATREWRYSVNQRKYMASVSLLEEESSSPKSPSTKRRKPQPAPLPSNIAIRDVVHPGFEGARATEGPETGAKEDPPEQVGRKICFVCWSSSKRQCALHKAATSERANESVLMCQNWDLKVVEYKYRNEAMQERFAKSVTSLRYDKNRKSFVPTAELKHSVYRDVWRLVKDCNFGERRRWRVKVCILSIIDLLRSGMVPGEKAAISSKLLQLKETVRHRAAVRVYSRSVRSKQPDGPKTGASLPETTGALVILRGWFPKNPGVFAFVYAGPKPMPSTLFQPRVYPLPAARTIPMPEPRHASKAESVSAHVARNKTMAETDPTSWLERNSAAVSMDALRAAEEQIRTLIPVTGMERLRRTKYPAAHAVKFATLGRTPTSGNKAVGGLGAHLSVCQLVQAVVPPQFGNLTTAERAAICPELSAEITTRHYDDGFKCPPGLQDFIMRALEHVMNKRRPPTITIAVDAPRWNPHFRFGPNRPGQTGEETDAGFRTVVHASSFAFIVRTETDVVPFTPGPDVAQAPVPSATPTCTTTVDHSYTFCEPSTRLNSTLDYYHSLVHAFASQNMTQVFSVLGFQDCGRFMHRGDRGLPLGPFVAVVYRSWSFAQRQRFEHFSTDDGLSYYYDRRTGETYWERPLAECEKLPVTEGGVRINLEDDAGGAHEKRKAGRPTHEMRDFILRHKESPDDIVTRRRTVAHAITISRTDGSFPPPPEEVTTRQKPTRKSSTPLPETAPVVSPHQQMDDSVEKPPPLALNQGAPNHEGETVASCRDSASPTRRRPLPPTRHCSLSPAQHASVSRPGTSSLIRRSSVAPLPPGQGRLNEAAQVLASSVAVALLPALDDARNMDDPQVAMLSLGLGLGMGLRATNAFAQLIGQQHQQLTQHDNPEDTDPGEVEAEETEPTMALSTEQNATVEQSKERAKQLGLPIGMVNPTIETPEWSGLDHEDEERQRAAFEHGQPEEMSTGRCQCVELTQADPDLTPPPDDFPIKEHTLGEFRADVERSLPVVAHPDRGRGYLTHRVAGAGAASTSNDDNHAYSFVGSWKSDGSLLRRVAEPLPKGFFAAVHATRVALAKCDYLPWIPNLPTTKPIGRIKPRAASLDWLAVGFDPWSAGKEPLCTEFVKSLNAKSDSIADAHPLTTADTFIDIMDRHGLAQQETEAAQAAKLVNEFELVASWARHGKYREIEDALNQPEWNLPIDYQDSAGNTLLSIAVQNCNKRIAKLCLRRGANVNLGNNNGQTCLHYAYSYGFETLAEYLKSKGADDTKLNVDGLTCYEGVSLNEVDQL